MRMIKKSFWLVGIAVSVLGMNASFAANAAAGTLPNILFIMTDDVGYGDLSCYGAKEIRTPHLDRLAQQGCRFTDVHAAASTCTPTRRALLTGTYSWRQEPGSRIMPGDAPLSIPPGTVTLASLLKQAGYATGIVGKWHLGLGDEQGADWNGTIRPDPMDLGFDYEFLIPATGDRVPCVYVENRRVVGLDPADPIQVSYERKVGTEPTGRENPELLKLKSTHGHDMTIVNGVGRIGWMTGGKSARWQDEDMADTLTSKALSFLERRSGDPFFLYFATHGIHVPRVPHPRHVGTTPCGARTDALVELDESVGTLLAALDRLGLSDNTLVIFTSDNGPVGDDGYEDVKPCAHDAAGGLRGRKSSLYEAGHRVPFLARWPQRIPAGSTSGEMFTQIDMLASFAALTSQTLPRHAGLDSYDVLPALLASPGARSSRAEFVAHNGGTQGPFAVRQGVWKLVQGSGRNTKGKNRPASRETTGSVELYNLAEDLAETRNLAGEHPEKVRQLTDLLSDLRTRGRSQP